MGREDTTPRSTASPPSPQLLTLTSLSWSTQDAGVPLVPLLCPLRPPSLGPLWETRLLRWTALVDRLHRRHSPGPLLCPPRSTQPPGVWQSTRGQLADSLISQHPGHLLSTLRSGAKFVRVQARWRIYFTTSEGAQ